MNKLNRARFEKTENTFIAHHTLHLVRKELKNWYDEMNLAYQFGIIQLMSACAEISMFWYIVRPPCAWTDIHRKERPLQKRNSHSNNS